MASRTTRRSSREGPGESNLGSFDKTPVALNGNQEKNGHDRADLATEVTDIPMRDVPAEPQTPQPASHTATDDLEAMQMDSSQAKTSDEDPATPQAKSPAKRTPKRSVKRKKAPKNSRPRQAKADPLSAQYLLENEKSLLVTTDLHNLFLDQQAWELLSETEQKAVLALMPDYALATGPANMDYLYLARSTPWRTDVRLFREELSLGGFDPAVIAEGLKAHDDRMGGKFDAWKEKEFEEFWGQKQRVSRAAAGESAKIKLEELIQAGLFEEGDIWIYSRSFRMPDGTYLLMEKECKISGDNNPSLSFSYPPANHKLSSQHLREDLRIDGVNMLKTLEKAIIQADGRVTDPANGNAWRAFRSVRRNQDLGGLWELRQEHWQRTTPDGEDCDFQAEKKSKAKSRASLQSKASPQSSTPKQKKADQTPESAGTRRSSRTPRQIKRPEFV